LLLQAKDDKANEKQVRDWVKQIKSTGGNSPIIVIANNQVVMDGTKNQVIKRLSKQNKNKNVEAD
jgi:uncharacterized protein YecE (DUF72 family)